MVAVDWTAILYQSLRPGGKKCMTGIQEYPFGKREYTLLQNLGVMGQYIKRERNGANVVKFNN